MRGLMGRDFNDDIIEDVQEVGDKLSSKTINHKSSKNSSLTLPQSYFGP